MPSSIFIKLASLLIVLKPILSPYNIASIPATILLPLPFVLYAIIHGDIIKAFKTILRLPVKYSWIMCLLSFNGFFVLNDVNSMIFGIIAIFYSSLSILSLWYYANPNITFKYAIYSGLGCGLFAIYQLVMQLIGVEPPSGQIEFLELGSSVVKWVESTWGFRFNSVFSEPSYFAMYIVPICLYCLKEGKTIYAFLMALFIILSSSTFGIVAMGVGIIVYSIGNFHRISWKIFIRMSLLFLLCFIVIKLVISNSDLSSIVSLTFDKLSSSTSDSEDSRLYSTFSYYELLPLKEQIFGVGWGQMGNYFKSLNIANYANSIVKTFIEVGILGFMYLVYYILSLYKVSKHNGTFIFLIVIILGYCVDCIALSERYEFILYFLFLYNNKYISRNT